MNKRKLPSVSFIIPTYNAEKYLLRCLSSIEKQTYPKDKIEVLVIDGGSTDGTLKIAGKSKVRILSNKTVDAESGKSIGITHSKGDIVVLLDSDNEIVQSDWLEKMVIPLIVDKDIFGVRSFYFRKRTDSILNRYCVSLGGGDPLAYCLFPKLKSVPRDKYVEYTIDKSPPPIGANGFLWRKSVILAIGHYIPRFEECDFVSRVVKNNFRKFARVKTYGIYHYYVRSLRGFVRKRVKIANEFLDRKEEGKETWVDQTNRRKFFLSIVFCISILGPVIEAVKEYRRTKEIAWLLHPFMCFLTVVIYSLIFTNRKMRTILRRKQNSEDRCKLQCKR